MSDPSDRLLSEPELRRRKELYERLNKQRNKEQVVEAIRQKQFPLFLARENVSFEDLALEDQHQILQHWNEKDYRYRTLEALESIEESTKKLLEETRLKSTRRGQLFGTRFLLPITNPLVQIDLVHPENSINLPAGVSLDVPRVPLPKMTIYNEGPVGRLLIGTNLDFSSLKAQVNIPPVDKYELNPGEPLLEYLNLRSTGSDITVNLILEV